MNFEKDSLIWHPFQISNAVPIIPVERASGSKIYTADGRAIIDAVSSWWVNIHGHAHPAITKAVTEQLHKLHQVIFSGFTHEPAITLAERVLSKLPSNQKKVFFSDNGSTAVEVAIKLCIQYWKNQGSHRTKIIALENSYHGDTVGAMSVGARSVFVDAFQEILFEVAHLPPLDTEPTRSLEVLKEHLDADDVCCFIFEPLVQGSCGMLMHTPEALDALLSECKKHSVPCIADEVMTGFGRTGRWFASDHLKNQPDLFSLSKGLTGGTIPMSLTTCTEEIWSAFNTGERSKGFFHGHSFTGNALACAAANASFELLDNDDTWKRIGEISNHHDGFAALLKNNSKVTSIRKRGTIIAFDVTTSGKAGYLNPVRDTILNYCLAHGVLIRPLGNTVYVLPPYCITDEELMSVYETVLGALEELS